MATLGSTAKPTSAAEWYGTSSTNQFMHAVTLPAGGPWRVYRVGWWAAGKDTTCVAKGCLWSGGGSLLRSSGNVTMANLAFATANSVNYEADVTDYVVAGGTTIYVGWWASDGSAHQNALTGSGSHIHDYSPTAPSALGSWTTHSSADIGAYLYYDLSNSAPTTPTASTPLNGSVISSQTPLLDWVHHDPDGDAQGAFQLQYATNSSFTTGLVDTGVVVSATSSYTTASLTRGTHYYWRVKTRDASLWSGWSSTANFTVGSLPTAQITYPANPDYAAPLYYNAGGNTTPKIRPVWIFTCPEGGTQSSALIRIYASDGTTSLGTDTVTGTAQTGDSTYAVANGTLYYIAITPTCSHGLTGAEVKSRVRARWGRASYRANLGATPITLSASAVTTTNSGQVVLEYGSTAGTTPEPTTWYSTVAAIVKQQYVWHRVTLLPVPASAPTSPTLDSLVWSYSANALVPDNWTISGAAASIDTGTFVYGTLSLKHTNAVINTSYVSTQLITVVPNTDYILSGRIKTSGNSGGQIMLVDGGGVTLVATTPVTTTTDWTRYKTAVWNSGAADSVTVQVKTYGAANDIAWFDALKMEASAVATPWTPGMVGTAVVLDAGGVQVDAADGGIFRLRGSGGATRDQIGLGTNGLVFGGDTTLTNPAAGKLAIGSVVIAGGQIAYAEVTANQATITTAVDLTSLTTTLTLVANRRVRITGFIKMFSSVANDIGRLLIDGDGTTLQIAQTLLPSTSQSVFLTCSVVVTPTAASHTYKLQAARGAGTGNITMQAAATNPAFILVEDLGPV